jgi:hypothetical protein
MASDEPKEFIEKAGKILETGMKFKKALLKRGLRRGRAKCPFCKDGFLIGTINGRKNHLHMACDKCPDVRMME